MAILIEFRYGCDGSKLIQMKYGWGCTSGQACTSFEISVQLDIRLRHVGVCALMNIKYKSTGRKKIHMVHFQFLFSMNQEIVNEVKFGGKVLFDHFEVSDCIQENDIVDHIHLWLLLTLKGIYTY